MYSADACEPDHALVERPVSNNNIHPARPTTAQSWVLAFRDIERRLWSRCKCKLQACTTSESKPIPAHALHITRESKYHRHLRPLSPLKNRRSIISVARDYACMKSPEILNAYDLVLAYMWRKGWKHGHRHLLLMLPHAREQAIC